MNKSQYKKDFLLELLPIYESDYARTEDLDFSKNIHAMSQDAYAEFGMAPVLVPALSLNDRIKFIIENIEVEQTA